MIKALLVHVLRRRAPLSRATRRSSRSDVAAETKVPMAQVKPMLAGVAWAGLTDNFEVWLGTTPGQPTAWRDVIRSTLAHPDRDRRARRRSAARPGSVPHHQQPVRRRCVHRDRHRDAAGGTRRRRGARSALQRAGGRRMAALRESRHAQGAQRQLPERHRRPELRRQDRDRRHDGRCCATIPRFRVRVRGHTAQSGDPELNRELSLDRAEAVARYMNVTYNVDPNRIKVLGMGSSQPAARAARRIRPRLPVSPAARRSLAARGCLLSASPRTEPPKDLSPGAIKRAVLGQSLQHPSVVYPAVLGALGGIGAMVVAGSPLMLGGRAGRRRRGGCGARRELFPSPRPHRGLLPGRPSQADGRRNARRRSPTSRPI